MRNKVKVSDLKVGEVIFVHVDRWNGYYDIQILQSPQVNGNQVKIFLAKTIEKTLFLTFDINDEVLVHDTHPLQLKQTQFELPLVS